jgi:hypothetical protein
MLIIHLTLGFSDGAGDDTPAAIAGTTAEAWTTEAATATTAVPSKPLLEAHNLIEARYELINLLRAGLRKLGPQPIN